MQAFVVSGPESSGSRYVARLLVEGGCTAAWEDGRRPCEVVHSPTLPTPRPELLVLHRSLPYGGVWADLRVLVDALGREGYEVTLVVCVRDALKQQESQLRARHVGSRLEYVRNVSRAWEMLALATTAPHVYVLHSLLAHEWYRKHLRDQLRLPSEFKEEFRE